MTAHYSCSIQVAVVDANVVDVVVKAQVLVVMEVVSRIKTKVNAVNRSWFSVPLYLRMKRVVTTLFSSRSS